MIISASRRTDIPAFYGEWLVNRLKAGEVLVRNPMQPRQVSRIMLAPETVDALVFWTKNPEPFLAFLPEIDTLGYSYYFLFTLTPYDVTLEPGVPDKGSIVEVFRRLSRLVGPEKVVWRYDPVVITDLFTPVWHAASFLRLAEELSGYTERCIISFLDDYRKVRSRMRNLRYTLPDSAQMSELASLFAGIAGEQGIALCTCSQEVDLSSQGIMHSRCIDGGLVKRISGRQVKGAKKDSSQRHACGCIESRDIGSYDTCPHGCLYCYAVASQAKARKAFEAYDPSSPMLCDSLHGDETITTPAPRKRAASARRQSDPGLQQGDLFG
ncbi:MAG: DUF1848 domain-containing protein [Chlorobiaceae bacterium]|nr:DUF1848 domain-containing protein [Chlorobiaceae bacterium]